MGSNIKTKSVAAVLVAVTGISLSATTYTWVSGSTDWQSTASYRDEGGATPIAQLPGSEDTVAFEGT